MHKNLCASRRCPLHGTVLAAGHESFASPKPAVPYFAISRGDGRTWENRANLVCEIAPDVVSPIIFLEEGPREKIYMGIASKSERELLLIEVKFFLLLPGQGSQSLLPPRYRRTALVLECPPQTMDPRA